MVIHFCCSQRSILPKTRAERLALKDKVSLERNRINNRVGWQARMHQKNAPENSSLLTSCTNGAAGYISNSDRFHTDVVGEEYAIRQEKIKKQQAAMDFKRNMTSQRDLDRWNEMQEKTRKEEDYYSKLREDGSKAKKNQSNVAYDILTLQYNQDEVGLQQKYADDMGKLYSTVSLFSTITILFFLCSLRRLVRYRAAFRSNQLVQKGDTRVGYNIISGDSREPLRYPDPVPKPMSVAKGDLVSPRMDRGTSFQPGNGF
jgi:hypothetical protein